MPIEVDVPDLGIIEFPDNTTEEEMNSAIARALNPLGDVELDPYQKATMGRAEQSPFSGVKLPGETPEPQVKAPTGIQLDPYQQAQIKAFASQPKDPEAIAFPNPLSLTKPETGMESGTEFVTALGEAGAGAWEKVTTPLHEFAKKFDPKGLEQFLSVVSPTMPAAIARERAKGGEPMPDVVTPQARKSIGIAVGTTDALADSINFFTSPLGIATMGMGALPKAAQTAVSMAFAFDMARQTPEIARELGSEFGKPEDQRDYQKISNLMTAGALNTGFAAMAGTHGASGVLRPSAAWLRERADFYAGTPYERQLRTAADEIANLSTDPNAPLGYIDPTKPSTIFSRVKPRTLQEIPGQPTVFRPEEAFPDINAEKFATLEEAKQAQLRWFQDRLNKVKPPKPEVPSDPWGSVVYDKETGEVISEPGKTTVEPPPEPIPESGKGFEDLVSEVRKRANKNMTVREFQAAFPEWFEGGKNKEGAKTLGRAAFGEDWRKQDPGTPKELDSSPIPPPEGVNPVDWMISEVNTNPKFANRNSMGVGSRLKTIDDLERLAAEKDKLSEFYKSLESFKGTKEEKLAMLEEVARVSVKGQLYTEAIEAATGGGGWSVKNPPLDWRKNPKVAEWLRDNKDRLNLNKLGDEFNAKYPPKKPAAETPPPAGETKPLSAREQYDQLVIAFKAEADLAKKFEIQRQIEELKNKHGGMPPPAEPTGEKPPTQKPSRAAGMEGAKTFKQFTDLEKKYDGGTPEEQAALDMISDQEFGTRKFSPSDKLDQAKLEEAYSRLSEESGMVYKPEVKPETPVGPELQKMYEEARAPKVTPPAAEAPPAPPAAPVEAPAQTPIPTPAPPVTAPPTQAPTPKPLAQTGHFDKKKVSDAMDLLKRKKPLNPPDIQGVSESRGGVNRPAAEWDEPMFSAATGEAPPPAPEVPKGPVLYPGEVSPENPMFEQDTLMALTTVGGSLLEAGRASYPAWYAEMLSTVGPEFRHYFRKAYNQLRDVPGLHDVSRVMTPAEEVELYNDNGEKVGKGSKHRPGMRVLNPELMPKVEEVITPNSFIGSTGDSLDWTQVSDASRTYAAAVEGKPAMLIANGPGVGKTGVGAVVAHLLTKPLRKSVQTEMKERWDKATPEERAAWLTKDQKPGDLRMAQLERWARSPWDTLETEGKLDAMTGAGYTRDQIKSNDVNFGSKERRKVLIVGVSKAHLDTAFKPDFERFGIPLDNITFITYDFLSKPGLENTPERAKFDAVMNQDYAAVLFDEAHMLKNTGSAREHNSRKIKAPFRIFMTATPMDNTHNAVYFLSEITGKTRPQLLDQIGLKSVTKVIRGEDREFVVPKPGIQQADIVKQIQRLREKAISDGLMVRREYPWWGEVIGREQIVDIYQDMKIRWDEADVAQRADWNVGPYWDKASPMEKAMALFPSRVEGEMPNQPGLQGSTRTDFTPAELMAADKITWASLRPEQKAKIGRAYGLNTAAFEKYSKEAMDRTIAQAGYTDEQIASGLVEKKGEHGLYEMDPFTPEEKAKEQRIYNKYQEAIDKAQSMATKRNLSGQRTHELNRFTESIKAGRALQMVLKELEAGRNVVLYANMVNDTRIKGLGASLNKRPDGSPQPDWPLYPGALKFIASELDRMNIPHSIIFGSKKEIKTQGIRDFYANRKRVALVTPESGGAGLNLDDVIGRHPRTLIALNLTFKGDAFEQLMYRVSRRNTASESKAIISIIPNAISDSMHVTRLSKKLRILRSIQAGKDSDLMAFLDDLNTPPEKRDDPRYQPEDEPNDAGIPDPPDLPWAQVKGRTGRIRWRAEATKEFLEWFWQNGGEEKPPYGIRLKRDYYDHIAWSDEDPRNFKTREREEDVEPMMVGGEERASELGGYPKDEPFIGDTHENIQDLINGVETLIDRGIDVSRNNEILTKLKEEQLFQQEIDERADSLLIDNPEYQYLTYLMEENPGHALYGTWESQKAEIAREVYNELKNEPGAPPEIEAATVGPNVVPSSVTPKSLTGDPDSMHKIMRKLRKGLGIPIIYKRTGGYGGFYSPMLDYIRIKKIADYGGSMHEAGHALDARFKFRDNTALDAELMHLGDSARLGSRSSWMPGKSKSYRLGEGVAEFVRYWIFDPKEATRLGPNMEKYWESIIDANIDDLGFMRDVRDKVQVYLKSDPQARLHSKIITINENRPKRTIAGLVYDTLDELHYLKLASDAAFIGSGTKLPPSADAYMLFRLLRGGYGRADAWLRYGTVNANTGDVSLGGSMMEAVSKVKTRLGEFDDYLVARQAAEMMKKGQETGVAPDEVSAVLKRYLGDVEFKEAFDALQVWQDKLLQYARDGGLITFEEYDRMKASNLIYVPMRRLYEVGVNEPRVMGAAGTGAQKGVLPKPGSIRSRAGSDAPIMSPLGSMVENAYFITTATEKNRALLSLANYAGVKDMGTWIRPVPAPQEKVVFSITKIRDELRAQGVDVSGIPSGTLLTMWRESRSPFLKDNIIRVRRGGKNEYYELDADLYKSVMAADKFTMDGWMKLLMAPGQVLRTGVTMTPSFILKNILRDTVSAATISRFSLIPFEAAIRGAWTLLSPNLMEKLGYKTYADSLRAAVAEWKASGSEHAIEGAYFDRDRMKDFIKEQLSKRDSYARKGLYIATHPLMALRLLSQLGEQSTRIGEYRKVFDAMIKDGFSRQDAHIQAAFEARDLQDFAMQGAGGAAQIVKMLVPFFNAGLQGNYRFYRSFRDTRNPGQWKRTLLKGFGFITMAKMAEQYINWDNDDYWDKPRWERMAFFHIPAGKTKAGKTRFILIPVPFEAGLIFASFPGAVMESFKKKDIRSTEVFGETFVKQLVSNPTPQVMMSVLEVTPELGYDYFQNQPLLPRGSEKDPIGQRYRDTTSLTSRKLGKLMGIAPAKIEHMIKRTTGGLGQWGVHAGIDKIIGAVTGEKGAPMPYNPIRSLVTPESGAGSQIMDDFYEKLQALQMEASSRSKFREIHPEINIGELDDMLAAEKMMAELRKQVRGSYDDEKRGKVLIRIENIAKPFVRTKDGHYKGFIVKKKSAN